MRQRFSLSQSEAALLVLLHGCQSLKAAAMDSGITIGNARTKIKKIMEKTGSHNQKALILLVERMNQDGV